MPKFKKTTKTDAARALREMDYSASAVYEFLEPIDADPEENQDLHQLHPNSFDTTATPGRSPRSEKSLSSRLKYTDEQGAFYKGADVIIADEAQTIFDQWMEGDCATALIALEGHEGLLGHAIAIQVMLRMLDADKELGRVGLPDFIEMLEEAAFDRRILEVGETMEK